MSTWQRYIERLRPALDKFRGSKIRDCHFCDNGRHRSKADCNWCGGSGKRRNCLRADCAEFGCGGYGSCYVSPEEADRSAGL